MISINATTVLCVLLKLEELHLPDEKDLVLVMKNFLRSQNAAGYHLGPFAASPGEIAKTFSIHNFPPKNVKSLIYFL